MSTTQRTDPFDLENNITALRPNKQSTFVFLFSIHQMFGLLVDCSSFRFWPFDTEQQFTGSEFRCQTNTTELLLKSRSTSPTAGGHEENIDVQLSQTFFRSQRTAAVGLCNMSATMSFSQTLTCFPPISPSLPLCLWMGVRVAGGWGTKGCLGTADNGQT